MVSQKTFCETINNSNLRFFVISPEGYNSGYFSRRWLMIYGYVLLIWIATPCLPFLVRWASSRWPTASVKRFVLGVEISMGLLLIVFAGVIFFYNRQKFFRFILIIGGSITASGLFYFIIPNPYELTHLPEYAVLGLLMVQAIKGDTAPLRKRSEANFLYLRSAGVTSAIGAMDELYQWLIPGRYFTWYDILLNSLGALLGLTIFWGISREGSKLDTK